MIKVLIADDHAVVRRGLRQILGLSTDFAVAEEAANGQEVLEKLRGHEFDVLLMDISMPGGNAVDLLKRVRVEQPKMAVLVHSMHNEGAIAARMLKAGAAGYITKDSDPEALIAALRKVAAGGRYIDPQVAEQMVFNDGADGERPYHESLSDRESQVFTMLAGGKSLNEIAEELHLSPKTVSTHKARLMEKLKVRSNAELIRYALTHHLTK